MELLSLGDWPTCVSISPDGTTLAAGGLEKRVLLVSRATGERLEVLSLSLQAVDPVLSRS